MIILSNWRIFQMQRHWLARMIPSLQQTEIIQTHLRQRSLRSGSVVGSMSIISWVWRLTFFISWRTWRHGFNERHRTMLFAPAKWLSYEAETENEVLRFLLRDYAVECTEQTTRVEGCWGRAIQRLASVSQSDTHGFISLYTFKCVSSNRYWKCDLVIWIDKLC